MKDETKSSRSSSMKSRDKAIDEVMDWEADIKDVLEQLLRDDVCNQLFVLSFSKTKTVRT